MCDSMSSPLYIHSGRVDGGFGPFMSGKIAMSLSYQFMEPGVAVLPILFSSVDYVLSQRLLSCL